MVNKSKVPKKKEKISIEESAERMERFLQKPVIPYPEEETRGVKPGTKRGPYQPRMTGIIKDKKFITSTCKQCHQEFTYKRKGKRLKIYCSNACKQKHYRWILRQKYLEKQRKIQVE